MLIGRMNDKVVLVTGGGSSGPGWGNGKAAAVLYAREGAKVFIVDKHLEAAQDTLALIEGEGGMAEAQAANVADSTAVAEMTANCLDRFGRIDVLHNNVGISVTGGVTDLSEESWHRVIAVNQTSVFLTCKQILPHMRRAGQGVIVNVGSVAETRWLGFPYAAYSASKAAVSALTRDIAIEYARHNIRANVVLPGFLDTPLIRGPLRKAYDGDLNDMLTRRHQQVPMGRMGDAWDTAYASLFLASDEARYITGTTLVVDGGLSASAVV